MSKGKRPRKRLSKRTTVTKRVNQKGYTNKYGTRVGPYNRKVSSFPNTYTTYRMINGEKRLCKITRKNGKEYVQVLDVGKMATRPGQIRNDKSEWVTTTGSYKGHTETWHTHIQKKKPLEEYYSWDDFNNLSKKELIKIATENNIEPYFYSFETMDKPDLINRLRDEAEKKRVRKLLINFNKREIIHFADYIGRHTIQRDCKTKADLIEFLSVNTHDHIIHDYIKCRDEIKGFSNDKKFIIRSLNDNTYLTENRIKKLVGEEIHKELLKEDLIYLHNVDRKGDRYYALTLDGDRHINTFDHLYKDVQIPKYQSMVKVISPEIMNSVKQLAKSRREYSIGLDFERELKNPQQIVAIQGAETFTYHLYDDFEMFGHTHPSRENANPSKNDLLNMRVGKPEFIVAGKTGKAIIMNIENEASYREWKKDPYFPSWLNLNKKEDRDKYFRDTGVRIYPYKKGMKVTLIDDPRLEKGFPFFSGYSLGKIHESERENISRQTAKKDEKRLEEPRKKRAYTTKADKTHNRINKEYNWIAMRYLGKDKMTPDDRINHLKYQIEAIEELQKDPTLSKKVIDTELEAKRKRLKMEYHYGMGPPTPGEYGIS